MAGYRYVVVPFAATAESGASLRDAAAKQLTMLIAQHVEKGFEYYRMDHYTVWEKPGCVAALFGAKATPTSFDVAIFRRAE